MLARVLYAAVLLSVLGAFPKAAAVRTAQSRARAAASAVGPSWAPRPQPERYCSADGALDIGRATDFAAPRIDR